MFLNKVDEDFLKELKEIHNNSVFLISRNEIAYKTYKNLCETIPNANSPILEFIEFPEGVIKFKDTLYDFQNGVKPLSDNLIKTSEEFLIYSVMNAVKIKEVIPEDDLDIVQMLSKIVQENPEFFV